VRGLPLLAALAGLAGLPGCERRAGSAGERAAGAVASAEGPVYRLEPAPVEACRVGATCAVQVRLRALGDFHVNREYPFRFLARAEPGVEHEGDAAFTIDDDRTGTLTVRFRAAGAGTARVAGTFKLSVCSDARCEIESAPIEIDVPAS
jgi:hypothetical protein